MKHTYALFLLVVSLLFPVGISYGQVTSAVKQVTKLSTRNLTGTGMETVAEMALKGISNPGTIPSMKLYNAKQKQLRTTARFRQESDRGAQIYTLANELEKAGKPLEQLKQKFPALETSLFNATLKKELNKAIQKNDYQQVKSVLGNYYSLAEGNVTHLWELPSEVFVNNAMEFLHKYGKKNLKLREVLTFISVDNELKQKIQSLLTKKSLLPQEKQELRNLLATAFEQYRAGIVKLLLIREVSPLAEAYRDTYWAALFFLNTTGRLPQRDAGPQEKKLAQHIELMLTHANTGHFEKHIEALQMLQTQFPTEVLEWDAFVEQYKEFVGNDIRRLQIRAWAEDGYSAQERLLYNSIQYYRQSGREQDFWNLEAEIVSNMVKNLK